MSFIKHAECTSTCEYIPAWLIDGGDPLDKVLVVGAGYCDWP